MEWRSDGAAEEVCFVVNSFVLSAPFLIVVPL
jgi:hypothetical protein